MPDSAILTLTMNPSIDKSTGLQKVEPNKKLRCQQPSFTPGGGGINVARAICKLGGEAKAVYPAGGPTGDILEHLLEKENVVQCRITTESWMRENLAVIEEITNDHYRFEMPGAYLHEHEWKSCLETILKEGQTANYLVASGSLPPGVPDDFYTQLAIKARDTKLKIIVDTSGESLRKLKGPGIFMLKPNLRELCDYTGNKLTSEEDQEQAARELVNNGTCDILVLSLGASGVLLVTKDFQKRFRSPKVSVKSRIGAGDSTVAGIVLGLTRKMDLKQAVMFGLSSGAAAVMTPGTELCRREDAERLYNQMKEEKDYELTSKFGKIKTFDKNTLAQGENHGQN